MLDFDGTAYTAYYDSFKVGSEDGGYRLTVSGYNRTKSTLADGLSAGGHTQAAFTTMDKDNDGIDGMNCAQSFSGGERFFTF